MKQIFQFLKDIAAHNDRAWFAENRAAYEAARQTFLATTEELIRLIAAFDPTIGHVTAPSTIYRIYRDVRFSQDKSPYKRHMGTYINARGTKSMHGGYYLHLQPGESFVAGGCWWLEPKVLREVRERILLETSHYTDIIEAPAFKSVYPTIGTDALKTLPKGFPKDFARPELLRPRNFVVYHYVDDAFFLQPHWLRQVADWFQLAKPFMDFVNETVDDYI